MKRSLLTLPLLFLLAILLISCGSDDPTGPGTDDPPLDPPPLEPAGAAVMVPLAEQATSRRFDLQIAVADSGAGIDHVEVWARPVDGTWQTAFTVTDFLPVRFTVPEDGPFGFWEFAAVAVAADGTREEEPALAEAATAVPTPIILFDRQGEPWDITHAVLRYGLAVHSWENGLGRQAIQALIDPAMSSPGDPDYLHPDNLTVIIGVTVDDDSRAYKIGDLNDREVVDDTFVGAHVAVTF